MTPSGSEIRFGERLLAWLDGNLPALPPTARLRPEIEAFAAKVANDYGLAGLGGAPLGNLDDATIEIEARLAEAGAEPMKPLTPEQFRIVGAGIPVSLDELRECSNEAASDWVSVAAADGHSPETTAAFFHSAGVLKGALVQSWRR